jgi:hypothetical protein
MERCLAGNIVLIEYFSHRFRLARNRHFNNLEIMGYVIRMIEFTHLAKKMQQGVMLALPRCRVMLHEGEVSASMDHMGELDEVPAGVCFYDGQMCSPVVRCSRIVLPKSLHTRGQF